MLNAEDAIRAKLDGRFYQFTDNGTVVDVLEKARLKREEADRAKIERQLRANMRHKFFEAQKEAREAKRNLVKTGNTQVVRDVLFLASDERVTLSGLMKEVSFYSGISVDDIKSPRRSRDIMVARMAFYYLAHKLTLQSYPQIGRYVGKRDHSTVVSGARAATKRREKIAHIVDPILLICGGNKSQPDWPQQDLELAA